MDGRVLARHCARGATRLDLRLAPGHAHRHAHLRGHRPRRRWSCRSTSRRPGCPSSATAFELVSRDDEAGEARVRVKLAVHNRGRVPISRLLITAPFSGQGVENSQYVGDFPRLGADEYADLSFIPDPPARFALAEHAPQLATPLVVVARWGGKVRMMLPLSGFTMRFTAARAHRPRHAGLQRGT